MVSFGVTIGEMCENFFFFNLMRRLHRKHTLLQSFYNTFLIFYRCHSDTYHLVSISLLSLQLVLFLLHLDLSPFVPFLHSTRHATHGNTTSISK